MKTILLIILFIQVICSENPSDTIKTQDIISPFLTNITDHLGTLFNEVFSSLSINRTDNACYDYLKKYYSLSPESNLALSKLVFDSSKNKNDVGTSSKCLNNNHYSYSDTLSSKNFTYLIIQTTNEYSTRINHFGICFLSHDNCNETHYRELAQCVNNFTNVFYNHSDTKYIWKINIFNMKDSETSDQFDPFYILQLIPLFIMLILSLFSVFPSIPTFLFQNCFKSEKENKQIINNEIMKSHPGNDNASQNRTSERSERESTLINKKNLCQFRSCFSLGENGEELFTIKNESTDLYNESGLSYIKGIRGLAMILMLFGSIFSALYTHPSRIIGEDERQHLSFHVLYSVIIFGQRTASSILMSCSGFCLAYKLICYLDDKLVDQTDHEGKKSDEDLFELQKNTPFHEGDHLHKIFSKGASIDHSSLLDDKDPNTIKWNYFLRFIIYQLPKYFLTILSLFFMKYSITPIMSIVFEVGPMFQIFKNRVLDQFSFLDLTGYFFVFRFNLKHTIKIISDIHIMGSFLEIFWMVLNEIEFYFLTAFLIFCCFKTKKRLDLICASIASILLALKIILCIIFPNLKAGKYYFSCPFYYLSFLPILNYQYYLIGVIFGLINYTIQKEITFRDVLKRKKPYLLSIVSILTFLKKKQLSRSGGLITLIVISLVLFFIFYFNSTLHFCGVDPKKLKPIINVVYLFDSELFVILLHIFAILCYLRGENIIYNFLSSNNWAVTNKIYFFFILTCEPLIMFIFYQSETRINVSYFSVFFYGLICGFLIFVLSALSYIFFWIPYKRIIKLIFQVREKKKQKNKKI